jgi:hypothetical protein
MIGAVDSARERCFRAGARARRAVARCLPPIALALCACTALAQAATPSHLPDRTTYTAPFAATAPHINGEGDEAVWAQARWQPILHRWLGPPYSPEDFQGRYKVVWTADRVFLLVEIVDDVLIDMHRDPLDRYWDDDCLEIFVDADHSGGGHQYDHNAFAYHVSLDNRVVDIGADRRAREYPQHVRSRWRQHAGGVTWELSVRIYGDDYVDGADDNDAVVLAAGRTLGLMVAYCDNDGSELRENFIGSESVPYGASDRGWIDAGLFGSLVLAGVTGDEP